MDSTKPRRLSSKTTILRIKNEKAQAALSAADTAYKQAKAAAEAAWTPYRDAAIAEGWCPLCNPAVPLDECPGHVGWAGAPEAWEPIKFKEPG